MLRQFKSLLGLVGVGLLVLTFAGCGRHVIQRDPKAPVEEWPTYGNDAGSSRFSPLTEITKENVRYLKVAWTYHTGDISEGTGTWNGQKVWAKSTFEATALMTDGTLYIATPFNRIIALDPETGKEKWTFDPKLNRIGYYGDDFTCRGLASRIDPQLQSGEACRKTIYEATLDGRLIAVDGETGKACAGFGTGWPGFTEGRHQPGIGNRPRHSRRVPLYVGAGGGGRRGDRGLSHQRQ